MTATSCESDVFRAGAGFQRADSSWISEVFGDYRSVQEEDLVVGAIRSVFYANRSNLNQFDTLNVAGVMYDSGDLPF